MNDGTLSCGDCGAGNAVGARFCNQCGSRLGEPQRSYTPRHLQDTLAQPATVQGERKRVTVLFADIKGSTQLAEQAGAELWHEVLDGFFGILSRVIHEYEGTLNQYTGDGIMALFGAPRALEDHAQFAARAALEMQSEVRRFADELRLNHGINLSMRVGLNSGEVVVGRIGDGMRSDYTAQGPTVNLAARMEHICEPGRVYLTRDTAALLEGYFRLRPLGQTQVAGLDQAVEVFELENSHGVRTRLDRSLARSGSPFIGREQELNQLLAAMEQVRNGSGQVVAVVGNAGIGKSRLCHEFANSCARAGIDVLRATGVPYASRVPLFPVRQLLRAKLGVPENATAPEARRWIAGALLLEDQANAAVLPYVFDFLGIADVRETAGQQAVPGSAEMMTRLAEYLPCDAGAAAGRPQVLLIEDLHFADRATEEFLQQLATVVRSHRCLMLVNFRPDYASDWLQPLVDESIAVTALQAAHLEQLARNLLGGHGSVQSLAKDLAERAGGNPFFVEEAVLALAEGGWLQGRAREWRLVRPIQEWPLPDSVQALLASRVDRLPDRLRARLQSSAVIGQDFDIDVLATLTGE
ncbi:MAG: AAA family ATPase, partial [Pseudomonadota bacterium]|nr:AAA family ATPase [Pseudomonadota bacterium]